MIESIILLKSLLKIWIDIGINIKYMLNIGYFSKLNFK